GKAIRLRDGADVTVIGCGSLVHVALDAADALLDEGIGVRVVNMSSIAPLDRVEIVSAARETGGIVTIEEHTVKGGLGGAVAEVVVTEHPVPMRLLGVPGVFAPVGSAPFLFERYGMTVEGVIAAVHELLDRRVR
ncbi:MAG: transketolase C-terminal domain-containing protein, partial [Ilumatobacteraceae bacterium]